MPFRDQNTSAFGPDDLDILTVAFNAAWEQLATTDGRIASEDQTELLKGAWRATPGHKIGPR
jgi:hypothetical protein